MSGWWVHTLYQQSPILLASWIFWVIFSITLHELAHGWAAIWQGDDTPRRYNRMNMNPLVHMGPMSLLMFALIGIAWGMMPVDPSKFRWRRQGRIIVSGAGPLMNIALGLISLTAAGVWMRIGPVDQPIYDNLQIFLFTGGWLNFALAAFNLLPLPPLDGSSILSGISFSWYRLMQHPNAQMIGMFLLLAVFLSGVGGVLFTAAMKVSLAYLSLLSGS